MIEVNAEKNLAAPSDETSDAVKGVRRYPDMTAIWEAKERRREREHQLTAILREALTEVDDNPERYEVHAFCNECAEGNRPLRYEYRLCWIHKARKLIGENHG